MYDYTHPEHYFPGLKWYQDTSLDDLRETTAQRRNQGLQSCDEPPELLCRACGWNARHEVYSGYMPRVKIFHTRDAMGMWAIGSEWLLRDEPNDSSLGNDTMTQMFIRQHPALDIPLPREMQVLSKPDDQIQFTLMSRCQGASLWSVWHTLDAQQKASYSHQMADIIKQMRRVTAPRPQKVDGSQMNDDLLGQCARRHYPTCKKIPYTKQEWIDGLAPEVRKSIARRLGSAPDSKSVDTEFQALVRDLPEFEPYVLTHGDLNMSNIIVKDDKIEAIIDWELSGFLPWWAERWTSIGSQGGDAVDEFFLPVWDEIFPDTDPEAMRLDVIVPLANFLTQFNLCPHDHTNLRSHYLRPRWCECKPYAGELKSIHIGQSFEHRVPEEGDEAPQSWNRSGAHYVIASEEHEKLPTEEKKQIEALKAMFKDY